MAQRVGHRAQVHARSQGAEQMYAARTPAAAPRRLDRDRHEHLRMRACRIPIRRAQGPVVLDEVACPVGRQRYRARAGRARGHHVAVLIEDQELGVVWETVADRIEIIGEPLVVNPGMDDLAVRQRNAFQVLRDLIRDREHAQVVAQLFGPEIDFANCLRTDAQQFLGGFGLEGALVFDVGNPDGRQRWQQRRDDGEHQHLGPDAGEAEKAQETQSRAPSTGCHKIHDGRVPARLRTT